MGRKSSVARLDPRIRAAVDQAVREGRATIDEILGLIRELGGEASRSAVGRHVKRARDQMERYREAQEVARVWIGKLEEDPQGDVGRLLSEMLKTIAFQVAGELGEDRDGRAKPADVMLLSAALKNVGAFDKLSVEREVKVRREVAAKLTKLEAQAGAGGKIDLDALRRVREEIYGIV